MAWVMARIWASVNEPRSGEPRCPLVPKLTRWSGSLEIGPALEIFAFEPGQIDQHLLWAPACRQVAKWSCTDPFHGTGQGFACQMSAAYSAIVRSLENFPEPATFRMALRAQASLSAYSVVSLWSASR